MAQERTEGDVERDEPPEDDTERETSEDDADSEDSRQVDVSDTTAPSIGPDTVIEREDPEERLARHEQSDTDAMGLDKRREVIGGRYSPSIGRQLAMYGIFLVVVAAIVVGGLVLVNELDQPPKSYPDEAPWSQAEAPNSAPQPIDFPTYGNPGPTTD
jgi:hypothetical protein